METILGLGWLDKPTIFGYVLIAAAIATNFRSKLDEKTRSHLSTGFLFLAMASLVSVMSLRWAALFAIMGIACLFVARQRAKELRKP